MLGPVIIDTNVLIDLFNGLDEARRELRYHRDVVISLITWIELMTAYEARRAAGVLDMADLEVANLAMRSFPVLGIDTRTMIEASKIRGRSVYQKKKLALPDAIIQATANTTKRTLVTRNTKDFDINSPRIRVPYLAEITSVTPNAAVNLFTPPSKLRVSITYIALPPN